jgi:CheY-like chemotaxis protein
MPLSTVCILVVDDYEPLRFLKMTLLRRVGAVVCEAKCGREALKMLETERLDLALLDFNLPDMSAKELCQKMRENPATSALPVIYTSASDRPTPLDPDDVFFQEPFDLAELVAAIKTSIGRNSE